MCFVCDERGKHRPLVPSVSFLAFMFLERVAQHLSGSVRERVRRTFDRTTMREASDSHSGGAHGRGNTTTQRTRDRQRNRPLILACSWMDSCYSYAAFCIRRSRLFASHYSVSFYVCTCTRIVCYFVFLCMCFSFICECGEAFHLRRIYILP